MAPGLSSSAYLRDSTTAETTIALNTKILENDIAITEDLLGGSTGVFRIWFSFTTGADYQLKFSKKGLADLTGFPLIVNGDNTFVLKSDGYYRFDLDVVPGDLINFSADTAISKVNSLTIQQIQIGA